MTASKRELSDELYNAMKALGPHPTQDQIRATCAEVLTKYMPKPEVDHISVDPDGTLHFTVKWV